MHTFTALFDKRADAENTQDLLEQLGIVEIDHSLHDTEASAFRDGRGAVPPQEDRRLYEEAVRRGGFLLTVDSDDQQADRVRDVLERSHAVDMDERERELQAAGFDPSTAGAPAAQAGDEVIPVIEEKLTVGKRRVDRGGVRVRAYVVESQVQQAVNLREEHVEIERRPVGERVVNAEKLFQERAIELTETAEEAVVTKSARVVEEVTLKKAVGERTQTVNDTVRHTEVEVEQIDPALAPPSPR